MHLLQSGVDLAVIAFWLGHEDPATTHQHVEADLKRRENALQRLDEPRLRPGRFRARERRLAFLTAHWPCGVDRLTGASVRATWPGHSA
jgi:hypothetical protein